MAAISRNVIETSGGVDKSGNRVYTVKWHIRTDNPQDQGLVVTDVDFLPEAELYVAYYSVGNDTDIFATCVGVEAERMAGSLVDWLVTVKYSTEQLGRGLSDQAGGSGQQPTPPSNPSPGNSYTAAGSRNEITRYGSTKTTRPIVTDFTPKAVVNSAGQPFDPTLTVEYSRVTISKTFYKETFTWSKIAEYMNAINDDTYLDCAAKTLRVTEYSAVTVWDAGAYWYEINQTFEYEPEGWNPLKVIDQGTAGKISSTDPTIVQFVDRQGNALTSPVPLDGGGKRLPAGDPIQYLEFKVYREKDFDAIV